MGKLWEAVKKQLFPLRLAFFLNHVCTLNEDKCVYVLSHFLVITFKGLQEMFPPNDWIFFVHWLTWLGFRSHDLIKSYMTK